MDHLSDAALTGSDHVVDSEGVQLAVRHYGGFGRGVLLLHGGGHNLEAFAPLASRLVSSTTVVAFDQRAHGRSDAADDYSPHAIGRDVEAVRVAFGLEAPLVVGHSWNARSALAYGARFPSCAGVVCLDTHFMVIDQSHWEQETPHLTIESEEAALEAAEAVPPRTVDEELDRMGVRGTPYEAIVRRSHDSATGRTRPTTPELLKILRARLADDLTESIYDEIACPVLLLFASAPDASHSEKHMAARRDAMDDLVRRHERVSISWLPTSHNIHLDDPDGVADLILDFVEKLGAERSESAG